MGHRLRERGEISLWNSAVVTYENVTTDRLVAVTNLTAPDDQVGVRFCRLRCRFVWAKATVASMPASSVVDAVVADMARALLTRVAPRSWV